MKFGPFPSLQMSKNSKTIYFMLPQAGKYIDKEPENPTARIDIHQVEWELEIIRYVKKCTAYVAYLETMLFIALLRLPYIRLCILALSTIIALFIFFLFVERKEKKTIKRIIIYEVMATTGSLHLN